MTDSTNELSGADTGIQEEKMVPQSVVNKIVGDTRRNTRAEMEAQHAAKLAEIEDRSRAAPQNTGVQMDMETITQKVAANLQHERAQHEADIAQKQFNAQMQALADTYTTKMQQGSTLYNDFDAVTKHFNPEKHPHLAVLLAGMEDAPDMLYELAQNPVKLAAMSALAEKDADFASDSLRKMRESIIDNKQGIKKDKASTTNSPLDRITSSSRINSGGSGPKSISDLRSLDWLR